MTRNSSRSSAARPAAASPKNELGDGGTSSGYKVWVQDGRTVVSAQAATGDGVTLDGVKELARIQIDCVKADETCEAVAVPEGVLS